MKCGIFSFIYTVSPHRVVDHCKILILLNQFIYQHLAALVVAIVVPRAMYQQKISLQVFCMRYWTAISVSLFIVLRQIHVPFLINVIV